MDAMLLVVVGWIFQPAVFAEPCGCQKTEIFVGKQTLKRILSTYSCIRCFTVTLQQIQLQFCFVHTKMQCFPNWSVISMLCLNAVLHNWNNGGPFVVEKSIHV